MNKLIFFDFDGTLTQSSSWYLFNTHFGMTEQEDSTLFEQYLKQEFDYKGWMDAIIAILKDRGLCTEDAVKTFSETLTLRDDAALVIQACKDAGYTPIVISGGLQQVIEPACHKVGIDRVCATASLVFDSQGKFSSINDSSDEMHAKVKAFLEICKEYGVNQEDTTVVGDGGNDIEVFKHTKRGIQIGTYGPLEPFAWKRVENLKEIIDFL